MSELRTPMTHKVMPDMSIHLVDKSGRSAGTLNSTEIAKRIVACVNASAGYDTDELECLGEISLGVESKLQVRLKELEAQQTELLAAAKVVIERWETPLCKDAPATAEYIYVMRDVVNKIEAEIAK